MKRYPLQTLLKLRAHRTEAARRVVLDRQRAVAACREECRRIGDEITALEDDRRAQRARLLDPPAPGVAWPVVLEAREAHIELLAQHIVTAQQRLQAAQGRLREAERALEEAKQAYFRARAREDALEKRKHLWRDEQFALEAHQEEDAAADLFMARYVTPGTH